MEDLITSPATKEKTHRKDSLHQWFSTCDCDPFEGPTALSQGSHQQRSCGSDIYGTIPKGSKITVMKEQ